MDQYIILKVLNDDIFTSLESDTTNSETKLKELIENNENRNSGIYAHGFKVMGKKEYIFGKEIAEKWLKRFCKVENINFEETLKSHTFLTPDDFN